MLQLNRLTADGAARRRRGPHRDRRQHDVRDYTTLEGPKLYKRNGWYYVFAPAGGVKKDGSRSSVRADRRTVRRRASCWRRARPTSTARTRARSWTRRPASGGSCTSRTRRRTAASSTCSRCVERDDWPVIGDDDGRGRDGRAAAEMEEAGAAGEPGHGAAARTTFRADASDCSGSGRRIRVRTGCRSRPDGGLRLTAVPTTRTCGRATCCCRSSRRPSSPRRRAGRQRVRDGERAGLIVFGADYAWAGIERTGDALRAW